MYNNFVNTDDLSVGYNNTPLIQDINIHLNKGEILTLIGPNGAGKSTILKTITKQLEIIKGKITIADVSVNEMNEKNLAKKMSVVLTERISPELMTCYDVVATGRYPYTGRFGILSEHDKEKIKEAVELVYADDFIYRDFGCISDGQKQRILLARAICQEPEIIVLDEPTSFLDIKHKLELLSILKKLVKEKNIAVIMSLHEIDLAQKISDYVVCIHNNKIEKYGIPEEIFTTEYIEQLYEIKKGTYNAELGCIELPKNTGKPEVFVIGGNGSGINLYRKLQQKGIPFAAGVLHENDIDYRIAKNLAVEIVSEEAFEEISDENLRQAEEMAASCKKVYCTLKKFGKINQKNKILLEKMLALGIEVCYDIYS